MQRKTDRVLLVKAVKYFAYTVGLMFLAPVIIFQAFKNQEHPWYIPVLIVGLIAAIAAITMGFYSIKTLLDAFFGRKSTKSPK